MAHSATKNSTANPAVRKRGGDPDVKPKAPHEKPADAMERKLEEGLEESMAGSDPVSITQPPKSKQDKEADDKAGERKPASAMRH